MSRLHEIKNRIGSVKSTKKITRAMYLISASKSQKAKAKLEGVKPYFQQIAITMSEILLATGTSIKSETRFIGHEKTTEDKGNLYIVLGGDKGMAGGYNHNILNLLNAHVDKATSTVIVAGLMSRNQIIREGFNVEKDLRYPVLNPSVFRAREIAEIVVAKFLSREYREVHIVYTAMITQLKQEPVMVQLLPLSPDDILKTVGTTIETNACNAIKYEPSPGAVFNTLVPHYVKGIIYGAFVEAFTSEQHARMYAMNNATKSADDMISRLSLRYNRARQALITQEINEIVSGIPTE